MDIRIRHVENGWIVEEFFVGRKSMEYVFNDWDKMIEWLRGYNK